MSWASWAWFLLFYQVRLDCPNAKIVHGPLPVLAPSSKVIDAVRNAELKRAQEKDKELPRGSKCLILRNGGHFRSDQKDRLKELLELNKRLNTVSILKEDLQRLWDYKYPGAARNFFVKWYRMAIDSRIEPLKRMTRMPRTN